MWRDDFVQSLAQAKADKNGTSVEHELKMMRHRDWQRRTAMNIKRMRKKTGRSATNQVYVTEEGVRRLVTDKDDMFKVCITENSSRFSQSNNTPPMTPPLVYNLGLLAETREARQVLGGSWQPPEGTDRKSVV